MGFLDKVDEQSLDEALAWEGTFSAYLDLLKQKPWIGQSAHSRIYNMIVSQGISQVNGHKRYHFFEETFYGLENTLERLVEEYFHPAAKGLDVKKRILLLMGPVSGGKSTLVAQLKKGLERYTRTDQGAVYAIKGCPMAEDPLHLIPEHLRDDFYEEYGIRIRGLLTPLNALRLEEEYGGKIEDVKIERIFFSESKRRGIGTFVPSDPKSQDISELTGSIDFSTIATYGTESDPRAYRFDGELNIANRGVMEFQEMLKVDERFLWNLLSLTQEGNFKTGRYSLISADSLIIAHTNEAEFRYFTQSDRNEALRSRMLVIPVPYTLHVSAEEKIYEQRIKESQLSDVAMAPHALKIAATFSILTRLKSSSIRQIDLLNKLKLYDGRHVEGFLEADVTELKKEHHDEGMSGIDPRFIMNRISLALMEKEGSMVNALDILRSIKSGLRDPFIINEKDREKYSRLITVAREEYDSLVQKEVQMASIESFEESTEALLNLYLDNVERFCQAEMLVDPITDREQEVDEPLMRSIEEHIGVSESAKRGFREEILIRASTYARKGKTFRGHSHEGLHKALQQKLFTDFKEVIKINTSFSHATNHKRKAVQDAIARLVDEYGYSQKAAEDVVDYVGSLLHH